MYQHRRKILLVLLLAGMATFCHGAGELSTGFSAGRWLLVFSSLVGGLGLFLMGMKMMSDSLTKSAGSQIRELLARLTQNRFIAFLIGIFATITIQLIAFRLADYALSVIALAFFPFTGFYARFINRLLPVREEKHASLTAWYLDEGLLQTPALALGVARQEVLRMMEIAERMTEEIIIPFMEKKTDVLVKIRNREQELNFLRDAANGYLIKIIRQDITSRLAEEAYQMLYAVDEFEQIGDIVSDTLYDKAESWCRSDHHFSAQGREEILDFHLKTLKIMYQTYKTFGDADLKGVRKGAKKSKEKYSHYRTLFFDLEKQHYERLKKEVEESIESSRTHMEIIASLKVIGSHATNIARILLKEEKNGGESAHRGKLEGHPGK